MARTGKADHAFSGVPVSSLCVRPARFHTGHYYTGSRTYFVDQRPVISVFLERNTGKSGRIISAFSDVQSNNYWSSTTNANNTDNAWNVNLYNGNVNNDNKTNNNYVWPVRGGE